LLESMQKIAILYDASQAILSTFDLDEVLNRILTIIRDFFQLQNGAVLLMDKSGTELQVRAHLGRSNLDVGYRIPKGKGLTWAAAEIKRPVYAPDVTKDPRYLRKVDETRSEVAIPLMVRDDVVGVLDFQSDQIDYFDLEKIDLLTLFSTQASMALENARLYSAERRRTKQLEAINAVAKKTTRVLDLDELLTVVCRLLMDLFGIDHAAVLLAEGESLRVRAHEGRLTPNLSMGEILSPGTGLAARSLTTGRSVIENDVNTVEGYIAGFAETQSDMCVPLVIFGE
jgi:sigma-B regulation protein RsbU (phosphoserine phosphatase)